MLINGCSKSSKFNTKIVGRENGDIFNTQIQEHSLEPYNTNVW